jgi:hypothetical protein
MQCHAEKNLQRFFFKDASLQLNFPLTRGCEFGNGQIIQIFCERRDGAALYLYTDDRRSARLSIYAGGTRLALES